jgi:hypothetical protein
MQSNTTKAEARTAKDSRIQELLEVIATMKSTLEECYEFTQEKMNFDNPKSRESRLIEGIDEAIFQADEVLK